MPRRDIVPAVREEYTHISAEEVVTAQGYYIDNNLSNRISINTNIIEPRIVEHARITVNDYWYDTINSVQILTEENAIDFLKKKGYAVYKKVMETE